MNLTNKLSVKNLKISYGDEFFIENLNIDIKAGEMVSIIGKSGSGKTSLLNILGLLDEPTDGEIYIGGEKIHYRNEKTKNIPAGFGAIVFGICLLYV